MINVYLISSDIEGNVLYKIGMTRRDVNERLKEFKTGNASNMEIIDVFKSKWASKIENYLHKYFYKKNIGGEWFKLDKEDINSFQEICLKLHNNFETIMNSNTYLKDNNKSI